MHVRQKESLTRRDKFKVSISFVVMTKNYWQNRKKAARREVHSIIGLNKMLIENSAK